MRLFLGIEVPEKCKAKIYEKIVLMQSTPKGWENPHDYHLTLLFIGEVEDTKMEEIKRRLQNIKCKKFSLKTTAIEFFNRRIMYLGVQPSKKLEELKLNILKYFPEWSRADDKEFIPHITLKRWQRYEFQELSDQVQSHKFEPLTFNVDHVALYLSRRDEQGRKYHILARTTLLK